MPHYSVFIIQPKIWAGLLSSRQKTVHLIFIQIHQTAIAFIFIIINIIDTCVTIIHSRSSVSSPPRCFRRCF